MANSVFKVEHGIRIKNDGYVEGDLTVAGSLNVLGNTIVGGTALGSIVPFNNNYSLGNNTNRWTVLSSNVDISNTATISFLNVANSAIFSGNVLPVSNNVQLGNTISRWDTYSNNINTITINVSGNSDLKNVVATNTVINGTFSVNTGTKDILNVIGPNLTVNGSVSFFNGNSNFDSGVLFVDSVSNRVGVNNSSPDATLTVTGTANVSANVRIGGTLSVGGLNVISSSGVWVGPSTGLQGPQGHQGFQGHQGVQGHQGNQGYQGVQGNPGAQGAPGAQGNQGVQGSQGVQGNPGAQGAPGAQGNQGFPGQPGGGGNPGAQGAPGAQGNQGVQGRQGFQGNQGFQGAPGVQGNTGAQGAPGAQGNQGVQGAPGDYNGYNSNTNSFGVGTSASGTTGEIRATNNITAYYSDDRLKQKIGKLENSLQNIRRLEGFYYQANELAQSLGYKPKKEIGLSAQQVQEFYPEIVTEAPIDSKYLTMYYERLIPIIIEAVKELDIKVDKIINK